MTVATRFLLASIAVGAILATLGATPANTAPKKGADLFAGKGKEAFCRRTAACRGKKGAPVLPNAWAACMRKEFPLTKPGDGFRICG